MRHFPPISNPSPYSFTLHLGPSAQVENCWKIKRQRQAPEYPCSAGLHYSVRRRLMNLITFEMGDGLTWSPYWQRVTDEKENRLSMCRSYDPSLRNDGMSWWCSRWVHAYLCREFTGSDTPLSMYYISKYFLLRNCLLTGTFACVNQVISGVLTAMQWQVTGQHIVPIGLKCSLLVYSQSRGTCLKVHWWSDLAPHNY